MSTKSVLSTCKRKTSLERYDLLNYIYKTIWRRLVRKLVVERDQRTRNKLIRANHGSPLAKTHLFGFEMVFDLRNMHDALMWNVVNARGAYEPGTTRLISTLLREGDTFVDVGANNGYFSLLASTITGTKGKVFAFEPSPATAARLRMNVELNNATNVQVIQEALWSAPTSLPLFFSAQEDGMNSLYPRTLDMSRGYTGETTVKVTTLDSFLPNEKIRLLKIDAEGAEMEILRGSSSSISSGHVEGLIVEWAPIQFQRLSDWDNRFELLRKLGEIYEITDTTRGNQLFGPIRQRKELGILGTNLLVVIGSLGLGRQEPLTTEAT